MLDLIRLCRALGEWPPRKLASLKIEDVVSTERELGLTLPDDLLVAIASRATILRRALGLEKTAFLGMLDVAEDENGSFPDGVVAISRVYSEPFAEALEGAHGGPSHVLGLKRPGSSASNAIVVTDAGSLGGDDDEDDDTITISLPRFVRAKMQDWYSRDTAVWTTALKTAAKLPLIDPAFRPVIIGVAAATVAERHAPLITVTHAKFGEGTVVETRVESGETKLVIDFASVGRKTLLERFVTRKG
jgi:hypothetical protein